MSCRSTRNRHDFVFFRLICKLRTRRATYAGRFKNRNTYMHIKKVSIQNLRSIRHFEMEFEQPAGWHVLIGDNGSGKTTILRGMAMAMMDIPHITVLKIIGKSYVAHHVDEAKIMMELQEYNNNPHNKDIVIQAENNNKPPILMSATFSKSESFSSSFGPFRRFTGSSQEWDVLYETDNKASAHLSLFREEVALTEAINWLVNLNYKRLEGNKEAKITLDSLKIFINDGQLLPHNAKITNISSNGVFLTDGNGQEVSVTELSDGFRSILSMTFEIIRQMVKHFGADEVFKSIKKGDIKIDVPGVVLIDEVDAHLHPTWQTEIGFWFTKYFPNIQFIVTTHSPLVCRACERGSIWRLAAPGSEGKSEEITGVEKDRLINGDILDAYGTNLFGQSPARAAKSNEKRKRLGQLNILHALGKINEQEEKERRKLQRTFTIE